MLQIRFARIRLVLLAEGLNIETLKFLLRAFDVCLLMNEVPFSSYRRELASKTLKKLGLDVVTFRKVAVELYFYFVVIRNVDK